ncbi:MAG: CaiB/BaiF CoA-transferase family protein [Thermodesulfobacteriota bacterium]|nr:CaiB/BaiF CoA-transferase family protein [Thermodesulfobacteriota bacterium]
MSGPLEGVKVLSFARALAGPFCTMLLCDLGAEVIKIEEPGKGDTARRNGPFIEGISSYFLSINRGQKSITLNLRHERAKKIVFQLVKQVDILVENFRPGVMERLGFGYEAIRQQNPKIVYASLSGFGQKGPYAQKPAYDMIAQGMGGTVSITGEPGRPPVRVGYSIGDMGAGLFSAIAILAALHEKEKSGEGQWIDVAMVDSQVALCENALIRYLATGQVPTPLGTRHPLTTPFQIFPTQDGYLVLITATEAEWQKFCKTAGREDLLSDHRFQLNKDRIANYQAFEPLMNELMKTKTTAAWLALLEPAGIMCGPMNNIAQVVQDPHIREREMIVEVEHHRAGKLKVAGTPMKFSRTACKIEKASPDVGEHTVEVLSGMLGMSSEDIERLAAEGAV